MHDNPILAEALPYTHEQVVELVAAARQILKGPNVICACYLADTLEPFDVIEIPHSTADYPTAFTARSEPYGVK